MCHTNNESQEQRTGPNLTDKVEILSVTLELTFMSSRGPYSSKWDEGGFRVEGDTEKIVYCESLLMR